MANVDTTDIRTYLKSLKNGSSIDVAKFLDRKKVRDPIKRGIASGNFKRIIEEFPLKKLELILLQSSCGSLLSAKKLLKKFIKKILKNLKTLMNGKELKKINSKYMV